MQAAQAASRAKGSYLKARYKRVALRRGKKKAIIAVGHKILQGAYYVLKHKVPYKDAGEGFFDQLHRESNIRYHLHRLRQLGVCVPTPTVLSVSRIQTPA